VPGDGKFDQDYITNGLDLAVGRIDFANLPAFLAVQGKSETDLLKRYLSKAHSFRHKLLAWQAGAPSPERAIAYGHFSGGDGPKNGSMYDNSLFTASTHFGTANESLVLGDLFFPSGRPFLWAGLAGSGGTNRINDGSAMMQHTATDLASGASQPSAAFFHLLGSYFADWNLGSDNFMRSVLAIENYGLACAWRKDGGLWRFETMAAGHTLGSGHWRMVNDPDPHFQGGSGNSGQERHLETMGDPTLRLHALAPPTAASAVRQGNNIVVSWTAGQGNAGSYVYRASSRAGPFVRITATSVAGASYTDASPPAGNKIYLVRGLKLTQSGSGSYTNISQGAFTGTVQ
jgi:hypothetical protein